MSATDKIFINDLTVKDSKLLIQSNAPSTSATEGAIFVSDGTSGLIAGNPYFIPASNGTPVNILTGGTIVGPGSSVTDNAIVRWNGTSGISIQNSNHTIGDNGAIGMTGSEAYIQLPDITAPANPGSALGRLYKKTGNDGIFWKPDASGAEVDLTAIVNRIVTATTSFVSTSLSFIVISGMTIIPGAGTYLAMFSSSARTINNTVNMDYALFNNGTIIQHSERSVSELSSTVFVSVYTQAIITVSAGQAIDVRVIIRSGSPPACQFLERNLILIRL